MPLPSTPNMSIVPALDLGSGFHRQKLAVKLNARNGPKADTTRMSGTGGTQTFVRYTTARE
jgi:hypothetical protein